MKPFWILQRHALSPHQIGDQRVTPVVQSIGLLWHGGGWLWQFPVAINAKNVDTGQEKHLPVPDTTRMLLWFLYALTITVILATFILVRRRMHGRKE